MRRAVLLSLVLVGGCTSAPAATPPGTGALPANATVVKVVDGDTIVARLGDSEERVRLIGIDTPETKKPDTPVQCFGPEASAFTAELLPPGTPVHLQRDVEARDRFDRLLAYVHRAEDGLFVNLEIVRRGYARLLTMPPNVAHVDEMVAAARAAERDDVGLWAGCSG